MGDLQRDSVSKGRLRMESCCYLEDWRVLLSCRPQRQQLQRQRKSPQTETQILGCPIRRDQAVLHFVCYQFHLLSASSRLGQDHWEISWPSCSHWTVWQQKEWALPQFLSFHFCPEMKDYLKEQMFQIVSDCFHIFSLCFRFCHLWSLELFHDLPPFSVQSVRKPKTRLRL